jgi:hypothetical protein
VRLEDSFIPAARLRARFGRFGMRFSGTWRRDQKQACQPLMIRLLVTW